MKGARLMILFISVFLPGFASGAEKIPVDKAVQLALENNHDYRIALLRLKESDQRINAVWGELFPVLESEASLTRQYAESGFMSLSDGQYDIKLVQMRFGINPGVFYNSLQVSRKAYSASSEEVRRIRSLVELQVIKDYFAVIMSEEMILLRKESISLLERNLKDVTNMYSTGSIPKFDLLQARVRLNGQYPILLEEENRYRTAVDRFNFTLGSGIDYIADLSVIEKEIENVPETDMEERIAMLTSAALKNRPEIVQVRKRIESSIDKKDMYDSYYIWPTFTVGGYYGMTRNDPNSIDTGLSGPIQPDFSQITGDEKWHNNWQVRVAATYRWGSLFRLDSSGSHSREEKLSAKEGEEELSRLRRLITINIRSGYSKLLTSYKTIVSQKENVETAREGVRIARESFRAGVIRNSELLSAELELTSAKTVYINAINSYYTTRAELKKEIGVNDDSLIFQEVIQ